MKIQRKHITKSLKILGFTILGILGFLILAIVILQTELAQSYLKNYALNYLHKKVSTKVEIDRVFVSVRKGFIIEKLYAEDEAGDSLLYVESLYIQPRLRAIINGDLNIRKISVNKLRANLYEVEKGKLNFEFFVDAFSSDTVAGDTTTSELEIKCRQISISESDFRYHTLNAEKAEGMNFDDLHFSNINMEAHDFYLLNDSIKINADSLSLDEKSGFSIQKLAGQEINYGNKSVTLSDFQLYTGNSKLDFNKIRLSYPGLEAFDYFEDSVNLFIDSKDSCYFGIEDAEFFTNATKGLKNKLKLSGKISGTVSKIQTQGLNVGLDNIFLLNLDSDISNLPNINNLQFNLTVNSLKINLSKLKTLKLDGDSTLLPELPDELKNISQISYNGNTRGISKDFNSDGILNTNIGKLSIAITAKKDSSSIFAFKGLLRANGLEINKIIDDKDFGKITFFQNIDFNYTKNKKIEVETQGTIDSLRYKNFTYKKIKLFAKMDGMRIDSASVVINQRHVKAGIVAKANLETTIPSFQFRIFADTLNLKAMNIEPQYKKSLLAFGLEGNFKGITLEDFEGKLELTKPFKYRNDSVSIHSDTLLLTGETLNPDAENFLKRLSIHSDIIEGTITQQGNLSAISENITRSITKLLPSFFPDTSATQNEFEILNESVEFDFDIKKPDIITDFVYPGMRVARHSKIKGNYQAASDSLNFQTDISAILIEGMHLDSITLRSQTENGKLNTRLYCKKFEPSAGVFFKNLSFDTKIINDSIGYRLIWDNLDSLLYKADVSGLLSFKKYENNAGMEIRSRIDSSSVIIKNSKWEVAESEIIMDSLMLDIRNMRFTNGIQEVTFDGTILTDPENADIVSDKLTFKLKDFEIANLQPLLGEELNITGKLTGKTNMMQLLTKPVILAKNKISDLTVNTIKLGELFLNTDWKSEKGQIDVNLYVEQGDADKGTLVKVIDTKGYYKPDNDSIKLHTAIEALKANAFSSYFDSYVQMSRSTQFSGEIDVFGTSKDINIAGFADIKSFLVYIQYLNTQYNSTDGLIRIVFDNKKIELLPAHLSSGKRNEKAELKGIITHQDFDKMKMDFTLTADNLQLNNTQATDTTYFYGPIYGTGEIKIKGTPEDMKIAGNIETGKNTKIYIPLSATETLSDESSFITFVDDKLQSEFFSDSTEIQHQNYTALTGVTIDMDVKLTPDAELQLIMDAASGDIIKARGSSDMKITMDTRGDINTFGDFIIEKGEYAFSLEGLINKKFTIRKGSKISLHGNPEEEGDMDIVTEYTLRKVPVHNLMAEEQYIGVKSTATCIINMKGNMMNPDVSFDVELSDVDEDIARQIRNLDSENRNIQFLSLLMISKYQPLPGFSQEVIAGSVVNTGEVLTAQVNRLLSDISENFDLGLNYEQGDQMSRDEIEVALSTNLWDDRITLNGNVGVGGQAKDDASDNSSGVVGEVEAELKLNRQGTMKMKVYNKANDATEYDKAPYTQGIGLFWRKQFNHFKLFGKKEEPEDTVLKK